jgi:hypothetical protein
LKLLRALLDRAAKEDTHGLFQAIPASYRSVSPVRNDGEEQLLLRGAVLLRVKGSRTGIPAEEVGDATAQPISPELAAALTEKPARPGMELLRLLRADGILTPLALMGALAIAVGAVLIETLLFRGLFDIAWALNLANQRLGAVLGLMTFAGLLLLVEFPIAMESLRLGRHLETRLRMALLRKLPRLSDRYFQSRPISDMAERSHKYLSDTAGSRAGNSVYSGPLGYLVHARWNRPHRSGQRSPGIGNHRFSDRCALGCSAAA